MRYNIPKTSYSTTQIIRCLLNYSCFGWYLAPGAHLTFDSKEDKNSNFVLIKAIIFSLIVNQGQNGLLDRETSPVIGFTVPSGHSSGSFLFLSLLLGQLALFFDWPEDTCKEKNLL